MAFRRMFVLAAVVLLATPLVATAEPQLDPYFYDRVCPRALPTITRHVQQAVSEYPRIGAALLRLHFHDCFVNGCDGSILLDGSQTEKTAGPNSSFPPLLYELIDKIKWAVDQLCGRPVVSCADILAVAARDAIVTLGGESYPVSLGRRDARQPGQANTGILPGARLNLQQLISNFQAQGLSTRDLVVLSSGHTIGFTKCNLTRMPNLADDFRRQCMNGGNPDVVSFDPTPARFDNAYYKLLVKGQGVLNSDQALFQGGNSETDNLVRMYSQDAYAHSRDFGVAMIKMGNIKPLTGNYGEIRRNCRAPNY